MLTTFSDDMNVFQYRTHVSLLDRWTQASQLCWRINHWTAEESKSLLLIDTVSFFSPLIIHHDTFKEASCFKRWNFKLSENVLTEIEEEPWQSVLRESRSGILSWNPEGTVDGHSQTPRERERVRKGQRRQKWISSFNVKFVHAKLQKASTQTSRQGFSSKTVELQLQRSWTLWGGSSENSHVTFWKSTASSRSTH